MFKWKHKFIIAIIFLAITSNMLSCTPEDNFDQKLKLLYKNTVPLIQPQQLAHELNTNVQLTTLDCRGLEEYKVSHIKNAKYVGYKDFNMADVQDISKESKIIVYCTVGYRSERIGEKLLEAGYTNVYNLYGGIIEWANRDYAVYGPQNKKTSKVHTYSKEWEQWLKKR